MSGAQISNDSTITSNNVQSKIEDENEETSFTSSRPNGVNNDAYEPDRDVNRRHDVTTRINDVNVYTIPDDIHSSAPSSCRSRKRRSKTKSLSSFGSVTGKKLDAGEDDELSLPTGAMAGILKMQNAVGDFWRKYGKWIKRTIAVLCVVGYFVYFGFAMAYEFGDEGSIRLLWVTCLVVFGICVSFILDHWGDKIENFIEPVMKYVRKYSLAINISLLCVIFMAVVVVVTVDLTVNGSDPYNLVSLSGLFIYVLLLFIFSFNPSKVKWRTVMWGFGLQFAFGLMILRWTFGYEAFKWLGDRIAEYLAYVDAGSEFVFGESYTDHFFAMQVLPTVIFMSSTITILFYLGAMQWFILKVAWLMQACMDTTAGESTNAAGNIFIGQTEAPLMIRPMLPTMTDSEVHAVMVGGFATIAGGVMAAYILFGVPANHLLSASVMSAPAALGIAKLAYPEVVRSTNKVTDVKAIIENVPETNIVEAAANGATAALPLVANIAANLLAFISLLAFLDATLTWFGDRIGTSEPITFEYLCSYALWPFAFVMGVYAEDCRKVGELIGVKTFVNEFVAFEELGVLIDNRAQLTAWVEDNGTYHWTGNHDDIVLECKQFVDSNCTNTTILENGVISDRSVVITTYALCGFSNISSIGIQIGAFTAMVPEKKKNFSRIAPRAMVAGTVACFTTACIAGLFYRPEEN